jgi:hypothetical protein
MDIPEKQTLLGIRHRTKTNKIKITTEKLKKMNNTKNRAEPGADSNVHYSRSIS